jgi:class 3 adenylate cyclase
VRDVSAPTVRVVDHALMSAGVPEMVVLLMTNLVGSTAMADRVGHGAREELRTEHFGRGDD